MKKEQIKKEIIDRLETLKEWRYNDAIENFHWSGVDEEEETELINFIREL